MHVRLTSPAEAELADALQWYATIPPGLSARSLDEYEVLLERLRENPWQFPAVREPMRRAGFRHFPYGLLFRIHPTEVEIVACFHGRRDPRRWQERQ